MDQLHMLRAFVAAAQYRSFSKAAEALGVSCGAISKAVARLERHTHTRLLHRTTRSVVLTEEAQHYYCSCRRLLEELDEANHRIMHGHELGGGRLRLAVHSLLVGESFAQLLASFSAAHPDVNVIVSLRDGNVDLFDGQFDMALVPRDHVEHSAAIRRTLATSRTIFVAAPAYLERHASPVQAADLRQHVLLFDPALRQKGSDYVTIAEQGRIVSVAPAGSLDGHAALLRAAALAAHGIAVLPELMVRDDLAQQRLVQVLPGCASAAHDIELCLFYTNREYLPARFRAFIDFCTAFFRIAPAAAPATREPVPATEACAKALSHPLQSDSLCASN